MKRLPFNPNEKVFSPFYLFSPSPYPLPSGERVRERSGLVGQAIKAWLRKASSFSIFHSSLIIRHLSFEIAFGLALILGLFLSSGAEELSEGSVGSVYELEPIVVTATRYPEYLKNIPAFATVLTKENLRLTSSLSLSDGLKNISGIDIKSTGGFGGVSTFSLRGSSASQVLVLLDGRPLNYINTGVFNLFDFPTEQVERIEIVRGPLSSLYGANALGGVVNIISQIPKETKATGSLSFGTFNTQAYSLDLSGNYKKLKLSWGGERKSSDNDRKNSQLCNFTTHTKLFFLPSSKINGEIFLNTQNDRMGVPGVVPDPDDIPKYGDREVNSLFDRQKDRNYSVDLTFNFAPQPKKIFSAKLYLDRRKMSYHTVYDNYDFTYFNSVKTIEDYTYKTKTEGGFVQYSMPIFKKSEVKSQQNTLTFGCDFRRDKLDASQSTHYAPDSVTSLPDTLIFWRPETKTLGFWGTGNFSFNNRWTFQVGMRLDDHSLYPSEVSPNLGLIYHFNSNHSIKFSWGKAYKAPAFNDLFWPDGGNPKLLPEKGYAFETSFNSSTDRISAQISFFYKTVKNLIVWLPLGKNGQWQPFNVDRYKGRGIEINLDSKLDEKTNLSINYTAHFDKEERKELVYYDFFTDQKEFENVERKARFTPRHKINFDLSRKIFSSLTANLVVNWTDQSVNYYPDYSTSPQVGYLEKTIKPHTNVELHLSQKLGSSVELNLSVINLLDEKVPTQFGNAVKDRDFPNPGRRVNMRLGFEI
jgi:outer membrane cobalamin receptor